MVEDPNQAILNAIGLYRVGTRGTIAMLLSRETEPDKRIGKLVKDGLLRVHKGLPGNRSVYQLTKRGAAVANVSPARGRIIGTQSLIKNVGVLLFCHVPNTERYRVEVEDLGRALGTPLPDGAYCLCRVKDKTIILECYVPGPQTPISTVVHHLKKMLKTTKQIEVISDAIKELRFGFAVIVPTKQRRKAIMDAIRTKNEGDRLPLVKRVRVWVEVVEAFTRILDGNNSSIRSARRPVQDTMLWESE